MLNSTNRTCFNMEYNDMISQIYNDRFEVIKDNNPDKEKAFNAALESCETWAKISKDDHSKKSQRQLKKECRAYIYANSSFPEPKGFIDSILWAFVIRSIVEWIIKRMFDSLFPKK